MWTDGSDISPTETSFIHTINQRDSNGISAGCERERVCVGLFKH